ncbi:MAG: hypothetical protein V3U71_04605 [Cocleimonas sp.]
MSFKQFALCDALKNRRFLCQDVEQSQQSALTLINKKTFDWEITLADNLLFDLAGLNVIVALISSYKGNAHQLEFKLQLSDAAIRDYYSHSQYLGTDGLISLPIKAFRKGAANTDLIDILLPTIDELSTKIDYPLALTEADINSTPLGLLMPYSCEHDCLFANQIGIFSSLNRQIKRSPMSWLQGVFSRRKIKTKQRISLAWNHIHKTADIHPTAVIEGSVIGEGCRVGAHCVVRFSVLGEHVQLHDGAKVEYSCVDDHSWLMHDLVLYRSLVESHVFLIHGPYQFSYFQKQSGAFASIMMDYRSDNKPIRIGTEQGVKDYKGRFLGALLKERSKVFGGTLTTPGITIPVGKEITVDAKSVTKAKDLQSLS